MRLWVAGSKCTPGDFAHRTLAVRGRDTSTIPMQSALHSCVGLGIAARRIPLQGSSRL